MTRVELPSGGCVMRVVLRRGLVFCLRFRLASEGFVFGGRQRDVKRFACPSEHSFDPF